MNIKVIENDAEFLSLKDDWDRLTQSLIPINKFDWSYRWWKYFKEGNTLKILVAEKDNKIVGIAPLCVKNMRMLRCLKVNKLCFLGDDISPYLDFLIEQDQSRELVFQGLLNYTLNNLSFDLLKLNDINSHYPNFDLWQKYADLLNLTFEVSYKCPKIRFSDYRSYDDYHKQLSRNHKHSLKFRQNRINKDGVNIEYIFKKDITKEDIEIVGNIHIKRQIFLYGKGIHGRFSHFMDKQALNFIKDYFCFGNPDSKMLAYMKCNETVISYYLILLNPNTISFWSTGFDIDYETYAPTKLLINELVKYAFQNKFDYLDFGRGSDPYKLDWTNDLSVNYNLTLRKSFKAKLAYLYKHFVPEFFIPKKFRFKNIKTSLTSPC